VVSKTGGWVEPLPVETTDRQGGSVVEAAGIEPASASPLL